MATGVWKAVMQPPEARIRYGLDGRITVQGAASEIGIAGVAAAANAIFHATGKRLRHARFTIDKILLAGETV